MAVSLSTNRPKIRQHHLVIVLLAIMFAIISILGTPFLYDGANSGRYLLEVIQAADPELFSQDSVVASLQRFDSLFYNALALAFQVTGTPPASVEPVMQALYIIYQFLLFFALFLFGRRLSKSLWFLILLGAWAAHQKSFPVGGNSFFDSQLTHASIALLLGILALYLLLKRQHFWFWALSGLAVITHSLHGLQLVLVVAPVYWWIHRSLDRKAILGIAAFSAFVLIYLLFMAPPPLSGQEALIFLETKGSMYHISPFDHSLLDWIKALGTIGMALIIYKQVLEENEGMRLLAGSIIFSAVVAVLLGTIAVIWQPVRLAQFQPMRIFFWVGFFAHVLILLGTSRAISQRSPVRFLLLGWVLLSIVVSLWSLVFTVIIVTYLSIKFIISKYRPTFTIPYKPKVEHWIFLTVFMAMIGGWVVARVSNLSMATLLDTTPLLLVAILVILAFRIPIIESRQPLLVATLLIVSLFSVSQYRHDYYGPSRVDPDWFEVQEWSRQHTAKTDTFIMVPNAGGNFRTRSFRTTLSEPMSALCWVDPLECRRNGEMVAQVEQSRVNGRWNVADLVTLAGEWSSRYILVADEYNSNFEPVFATGRYAIFQVP